MAMRLSLSVVVICMGLATAALAAGPAELERGRLLAEQMCGRCHATGASGQSPHKITPPFRDLAERFPVDMLVEALKTGEISGHDEMPMFVLAPEDMRALIAHIDSFAGPKARYLEPAAK